MDTEVSTAVILAGGLGTRLRSVVPDLPKPMAPVDGRPFLAHQMDYWIGQGIKHFVLSVGYRRDAIVEHFGSSYRQCGIEYVCEEIPLGTGGALLLALDRLPKENPVVVLNGDTFFEVDKADMLRVHGDRQADWTLALFRTDDRTRYMGVEIGTGGVISSFQSTTNRAQLANGGVYVLQPTVFTRTVWRAGQKASLEDEVMPDILAAGAKIVGYVCDKRFIDIGMPDDYVRAAAVMRGST